MALVTMLVNERSVFIFSKSSCCMSHTIKTLISSFGANPTVFELDEHPKGQEIEKELKGLGCKPVWAFKPDDPKEGPSAPQAGARKPPSHRSPVQQSPLARPSLAPPSPQPPMDR